MVIFVDGFQSCGKTTLISNCRYEHARFPFNQHLSALGIPDLTGFQLGKDLGIMFALQGRYDPLVLDRGPFSTIFYSLKECRHGEKTPIIMARFLKELASYKGFRYVFVTKKNAPVSERKRGDGFDYLDDDSDKNKEKLLEDMVREARAAGIKIEIFENDFSMQAKRNSRRFNALLERLAHEHD